MLVVIIDTDPDPESARAAVDQALSRLREDPQLEEQAAIGRAYIASVEQAYAQPNPAPVYAQPAVYQAAPMQAAPIPGDALPYTPDPTDNFIPPNTDPFAEHAAQIQYAATVQPPNAAELEVFLAEQRRAYAAQLAAEAAAAGAPQEPQIIYAPADRTTGTVL